MVFELVFLAAGALAQPNAAEKETARRLMDRGKAALAHHDYAAAVTAYTKAAELVHLPTTALALARAELAAGHLVEARDAALDAARLPETEGEPRAQPRARAAARDIAERLKSRIPTVLVKLQHPQDAKLTLDGQQVPLVLIESPIAVNPGRHVLVASLPSGGERSESFEAAEGKVSRVSIDLPVETPSTPPVDTHDGQAATIASVSTMPPPRPAAGARGLVVGGLTLGGIGVGFGAIFGALTFGAANAVRAKCTGDLCSPSVAGDLSDGRTYAVLSDIGFIAAGVGAVLAITGVVLWPKQRHVALGIGPGTVLLTGEFE